MQNRCERLICAVLAMWAAGCSTPSRTGQGAAAVDVVDAGAGDADAALPDAGPCSWEDGVPICEMRGYRGILCPPDAGLDGLGLSCVPSGAYRGDGWSLVCCR